jgi:hypothetical protein
MKAMVSNYDNTAAVSAEHLALTTPPFQLLVT